jgi:hypothetical protein
VKAKGKSRRYGKVCDADHIIALLGETVSGLRVENNLRAILETDNRKKPTLPGRTGGRCRFRTCDPVRVKDVLYP